VGVGVRVMVGVAVGVGVGVLVGVGLAVTVGVRVGVGVDRARDRLQAVRACNRSRVTIRRRIRLNFMAGVPSINCR
jgi:hypothetical protein